MEKTKYFLWTLVGVATLWSIMSMFGLENGKSIDDRRLLLAVNSAIETIDCGYSDEFSIQFTPTQAVENYINLLDSTKTEAEEILKQAGKIPLRPIHHVVGKVDSPWEVVFQPNNKNHKIVVLGYGRDLSIPLFDKEILCK